MSDEKLESLSIVDVSKMETGALCEVLNEELVDKLIENLQKVKERWHGEQEGVFKDRWEDWQRMLKAAMSGNRDWKPNLMILGEELSKRFDYLSDRAEYYNELPDRDEDYIRKNLFPEGIGASMSGKGMIGDKVIALIYNKDLTFPTTAEELQEIEELHIQVWELR